MSEWEWEKERESGVERNGESEWIGNQTNKEEGRRSREAAEPAESVCMNVVRKQIVGKRNKERQQNEELEKRRRQKKKRKGKVTVIR